MLTVCNLPYFQTGGELRQVPQSTASARAGDVFQSVQGEEISPQG